MAIVQGLLLIFVASSLIIVPVAQATDCQLKQYASLDLAVLRNGFLVVPVTIQGSPVAMILNTANPFSSVTETAAGSLALQLKSLPSGAKVRSGMRQIDKLAIAKEFSIGGVRFKSAEFMVIPNDTFDPHQGVVPLVGILGMDVLGHFDVELDASNRKMNLFSQDHCPGHTVYWSNSYDSVPIRLGELGELYFPMELDGKKIETTLATGNQTTSLSTDVTRKLYNFDSHSPDIENETDAGGRRTASYRAMKLSGEGIQIINTHILLIDRPPNDFCSLGSRSGAAAYEGCLGAHPLQLGLNVLTKLHLYIATKEKVLYFTPAEAPK